MEGDVCKKRRDNAESEDVEPEILYNDKHRLFVGCHPTFIEATQQANYRYGMTVVAMAIAQDDWQMLLQGGDARSLESRKMYSRVEAAAMKKMLQLEWDSGARTRGKTFRSKTKTLHSLGGRFLVVLNRWRKVENRTEEEIESNIRELMKGGGVEQQQQTGGQQERASDQQQQQRQASEQHPQTNEQQPQTGRQEQQTGRQQQGTLPLMFQQEAPI